MAKVTAMTHGEYGTRYSARVTWRFLLVASWLSACGLDEREPDVVVGRANPADAGPGPLGSAPPVGTAPALTPVQGSGGLTLFPSVVGFGSVTLGTSARANLGVSNDAAADLAVAAPAVVGVDASAFRIEDDGCGERLVPGERCAITLGFQPSRVGEHSARLQLGEALSLSLSGTGLMPGVLAFAEGASADLGPVSVGGAVQVAFTLTAPAASNGVLSALELSNPEEFQLVPGGVGFCQPSVTRLGAAGCQVQVEFAPDFGGTRNATLTASAGALGSTSLALVGTGLAAARLVGAGSLDFGNAEVGASGGPTRVWQVLNDGGSSTGPLTFSNSNPDEFSVTGLCTELAAGESCDLNVTFNPQPGGSRSARLELAGAGGVGISLDAAGRGQFRVTVTTTGQGSVSATEGPGIDCGARCTGLFDESALVTFQARVSNGSNQLFSGWSDASCPPPLGTCQLRIAATTNLTASFTPLINNLVFFSSTTYPPTLGSATAYDAGCNEVATRTGLNNSTGDGFVAMMSDANSTFVSRLGSARGWVRMDGRPFIDRFSDLVAGSMYYPVRYDELGRDSYQTPPYAVWTGTEKDGLASTENCNNWTSDSGALSARVGNVDHGPLLWTGGVNACDEAFSPGMICLGRTQSAPIVLTAVSGKRFWTTTTPYTPGSMTPDAKCAQERPAGVTQARALIAHPNVAASSLLVPTANYVRPDGVFVGTGAQIANEQLLTAAWLNAANQSSDVGIWVGSLSPTLPGSSASTCNDWTSTAGPVRLGLNGNVGAFWRFSDATCDTAPTHLFCVEP